MPRRIEALTFFRFLAATIVIFFHFGKSTELAKLFSPFIISGPQMVTFFFTLSGFVLMISHYYKKDETLKKFYVSRVSRIVPMYIIALLLMVYFEYGMANNNAVSLILSIGFMQSWFPTYALSFNIPAWSLSIEAFFYLTFPLVLFLIKKSQIKSLNLTIYAIGFYIFTQITLSTLMGKEFSDDTLSIMHNLLYYFPLSHYCSFILGVTGGYIYIKNKKYFFQQDLFSLITMILVLYITYYSLQNPKVLSHFTGAPLAYKSSFYALLFIIFILNIAYSNNFITKTLSLPIFVLLGEASYAMYILQQPVYLAYKKYLSNYLYFNHSNDFYTYVFILSHLQIQPQTVTNFL